MLQVAHAQILSARNAFRFLLIVLVSLGTPTLFADETTEKELAQKAPEILMKASTFVIGGVGYSGVISANENALRALLKRPDALAECRKLTSKARSAGKLYGLLGLKLLDDPSFKAALLPLRDSKEPVREMSGCIIGETSVSSIARQIEEGNLK